MDLTGKHGTEKAKIYNSEEKYKQPFHTPFQAAQAVLCRVHESSHPVHPYENDILSLMQMPQVKDLVPQLLLLALEGYKFF